MRSDESLPSLMTRIDASIVQVKNLHPSAYTLKDLDEALICMTMICALPSYANFAFFAAARPDDQGQALERLHQRGITPSLLYQLYSDTSVMAASSTSGTSATTEFAGKASSRSPTASMPTLPF